MSSEGFLNEIQTIGEKFLLKLQKLPKAEPVEIVSFCIILFFIVTVLSLMIIACSCCCYRNGGPDQRGRKIQIQPTAHV
ncbi:small integral membrane protein 5 [Dermochelys coriacea]|uniref:small integral membrane protein 5 n=1 Tax=Dermochelys coriacea TaxID=27794 RepID=UPI0018E84F6C|nr:small integral membrane protein 5 [Dermochelys coriacea]XP_043353471.1 small integral membrane protein 5 [Dermochelys coriacea]XP_043353472.1 small integral membrane protein 5 [Dermochelys coriacea]XP_043353473.1 small integral membrane protein 5 [Dermochelys coriacea]XP_043353475.1 small integral membrane protein 5 [Dermochelys coriacea]XP_043353476.1 small integral membrane protein 5 [Dermochelys coriacea]XP_043353477.1 small integral membrane protein 5 [Dermochelys coriacea]